MDIKLRKKDETPAQKVVFKYKGINLAELDIRNSGENHYKEVLSVMSKLKVIDLLIDRILFAKNTMKKSGFTVTQVRNLVDGRINLPIRLCIGFLS